MSAAAAAARTPAGTTRPAPREAAGPYGPRGLVTTLCRPFTASAKLTSSSLYQVQERRHAAMVTPRRCSA